ncbi:hypothetical protein IEN85_22715 [Pelagicoccus sp. NFK12]|uniref:Uncharacterized protein n=2 Tax=Pelagicoccus enzymogenes TaxID=2773457 RepID=A0A927FEQ4_9BACT|nr:hypothetical protein [Pelagicoccus enzymogenes]
MLPSKKNETMMYNLLAGWIGMAAGVLSGAAIGLFFHRDKWLGGYSSFERRMLRLGHIAFFGIGFLNILFALTLGEAQLGHWALAGSWALAATNLLMPLNCFLSAWKKAFRHLFCIPVLGASWGVATAIIHILNTL